MSRLHTPIRRNDTVIVTAGKDSGKRGRVLKVLPEKNRLIVEGVNVIKRHTRPNPQRNIKGGSSSVKGRCTPATSSSCARSAAR
jgi:large subunit ribosomal protein L24